MNDEDLRINYDVFKGAEVIGGAGADGFPVCVCDLELLRTSTPYMV